MERIEISGRRVGPDSPTYIVAEAGTNHDGDLERAKALIDIAADAGVDAVKFQTFRARNVTVEESGSAAIIEEDSIYDVLKDLEMPYEWIPELATYCGRRGVDFLSTATDTESLEHLDEYVPAYKLSSYELSHLPFLKELAKRDKPLILSTGVHSRSEIREALELLRKRGKSDLVLLHCVGAYPTPIDEINVQTVRGLHEEFGLLAGLSDHTRDPLVAPGSAVALGAVVIEKHYTFSRSLPGPDHSFALEPDELQQMVEHVRGTERSLGAEKPEILNVESEMHEIARRHVHATEDIEAGETLSADNIAVLRSGQRPQGLHPRHYEDLLGAVATDEIQSGDPVDWDCVDKED